MKSPGIIRAIQFTGAITAVIAVIVQKDATATPVFGLAILITICSLISELIYYIIKKILP